MPRPRWLARFDPAIGAYADGFQHERDEYGFCGNCGASGHEPHYALKSQTPIFSRLLTDR